MTRTVHATLEDGREIVRRDDEWATDPGVPVSLEQAVELAAQAHVHAGQIHYGQPGGEEFDRLARPRVDALYRALSG